MMLLAEKEIQAEGSFDPFNYLNQVAVGRRDLWIEAVANWATLRKHR